MLFLISSNFSNCFCAANLGDPEAQYELGMLYVTGTGIKKDHREAMYWFILAADRKHPAAVKQVEKLKASALKRPEVAAALKAARLRADK